MRCLQGSSGPGIAADELPHVFVRLWRRRAAKQVAGSGIGIAVARKDAVAYRGGVEVASPEGDGITITV
jgi:signal transduction histidine kinase